MELSDSCDCPVSTAECQDRDGNICSNRGTCECDNQDPDSGKYSTTTTDVESKFSRIQMKRLFR